MLHEDNGNNDVEDFSDWNGAYSLVTKWENNDWYFWTDLSFADRKNGDVWGIQLMPLMISQTRRRQSSVTPILKVLENNQLRASRWEDRLPSSWIRYRGDKLTEYFVGLNYFLYGHKLKWQNGLQYTEMDKTDGTTAYDGWGFTTAFRISW